MSEPRGGCPCRYTTPCSPNCTCANDASSAGCRRCARYGSPQQKKAMAEHIAATLDKGLAYDALAERVRKAEEENSRLRAQIYQLVPVYDGDNNYQPPHVADDGMLEFDLVELPDLNRYTFNGKEYRIFFAVDDKNGDGFCERRNVPDALLWVAWELQGPRLVEVCVHEAIHACLDNLTEEETDRIAKDVSSFTYRVLLRRDASAKKAHEKWIAGQKENSATSDTPAIEEVK